MKTTSHVVQDPEMRVPYLVSGDQWVGYDDVASIANKVSVAKHLSVSCSELGCCLLEWRRAPATPQTMPATVLLYSIALTSHPGQLSAMILYVHLVYNT